MQSPAPDPASSLYGSICVTQISDRLLTMQSSASGSCIEAASLGLQSVLVDTAHRA